MRLKLKLALIGLSSGMIASPLSSCARFFGDLVGDAVFLRGVD